MKIGHCLLGEGLECFSRPASFTQRAQQERARQAAEQAQRAREEAQRIQQERARQAAEQAQRRQQEQQQCLQEMRDRLKK